MWTKIAAPAVICAIGLCGCTTIRNARDAIVQPQPVCADSTVQIYFEPDSAEVTAEGQAVLRKAAEAARGCEVARVDVLGLADASGRPDPNLALSQRRAQSVTAALANAGLPDAEFQLNALGQADARTPEGSNRPLRRRVDVVLRLRPRA